MALFDQLINDIKGGFASIAADMKAVGFRLLTTGGAAGQVYTKLSSTDYDAGWQSLPAGGAWTNLTASFANGTATVACGANPLNYCPYTTTAHTLINVTGSGSQEVRLLITLGGAHTLTFQYNSGTGSIKWPGNQVGSFPATTGNVYLLTCFANGTTLRIQDYQMQT